VRDRHHVFYTMELNANVSDFVLPPAGNHAAVCCGVVYCGTVPKEFEGKPKMKKVVYLYFELSNTNHVFDANKGPEPFVIRQEYSLSMGKNANLRKMLEGWRGQPFTDAEAAKFNIFSIVKAPCQVNLVKKISKANKERIEVYSVSQLMAGVPVPTLRTALTEWKMPDITKGEKFDTEGFNKLHSFIQNDIKASDEYKAMANGTPTNVVNNGQAGQIQQPVQQTQGNQLPF
jgi:hypothetical protein